MKNRELIVITIIVFCLFGGSCLSQAVKESTETNVEKNVYAVKLSDSISRTNNPTIKEVRDLSGPTTLFNYVSGSNYVVTAIVRKQEYVGKIKKQKELDVSDYLAMYVFSLDVEKTLCSEGSLSNNPVSEIKQLETFQLIVPAENLLNENYKEGEKFLLFINEVNKEEDLSNIYELKSDKSYYRVFEGEECLLPDKGNLHSPRKKGRINVSDSRYKSVIKRIEIFCSALNTREKQEKIQNLIKLLDTDDQELKENVLYAIEKLQG